MPLSTWMSNAFDHALRFLARREHGAYELAQKLEHKGYDTNEIQDALAQCQRLGLQSDMRFAENLCRTRVRQGYGSQKIARDLQQVRIDKAIINEVLSQEASHWLSYARDVIHKKYGQALSQSYAVTQKQKQFLLYRGFSMDIIHQLFREFLT